MNLYLRNESQVMVPVRAWAQQAATCWHVQPTFCEAGVCLTCCGGGAGVCGCALCMTSLSLIGGACNHCLVRLVFAASIDSVFPYMCGNCCRP